MKFGEMPVTEAIGAILAHSLRLGAVSFKKGRVLSADDVAALQAAGRTSVVAARLETGDVPEDQAAAAIARAVAGEHLVVSAAFTGRANLYAARAGLAIVDVERVNRLNLSDESITLATVPAYAPVEPRQMVATVKIIPFAAPESALKACLEIAQTPLVRVAPYQHKTVTLIQTQLAGLKPSVIEKTVAATRARLEAMGSSLAADHIVAHDTHVLAEALVKQQSDLILVLGASANVDRRDVIPAAIEAAGGTVRHFGMPVDPGNLLLLGRIGERNVIGLPGCARSPKLNGFDWVLQRLLAGEKVDRVDVMRMGVGGLLSEISSRPLPRQEAAPEPGLGAPRAPKIAAVVLAAGRSSRMAPANKLLTEVDGRRMVERAVDAALSSQARPVIVVTGHDGTRVREAVGTRAVTVIENPEFAGGLASSLRAGLAAVPADCDGAVFVLGDMPRVEARHIDRLIAAFNPLEGRAICVPTYRAKRGNPVLWAARFFGEMRGLSGDAGARVLLGTHADQVCEVEMDDDGVLLDIDTPEALAALRGEKASA